MGKEESVTKIITCSPKTVKEFCRIQEHEEAMHNFDRGKKARATRKAETLTKEPKDRTKSRPNPKAKFKQRKKR